VSSHIALIGDSSFDNGQYTRGQPDVAGHLRSIAQRPWRVTNLALDGSTVAEVESRLPQLSADVSHVAVSVGGNDVLRHWGVLRAPAVTNADALLEWSRPLTEFESTYRQLIDRLAVYRAHMTVCTIYNGQIESVRGDAARLALRMFNDVVLRVAFERGLAVVDLRLICRDPADYATPIEPSGQGGYKIAAAIARAAGLSVDRQEFSRVFVE